MLKYRTAHITDLPAMMKMVNEAKEGFRSRNIDQWQKGEPNEQGLTEAIKKDLVHVLEESNEQRSDLGCTLFHSNRSDL